MSKLITDKKEKEKFLKSQQTLGKSLIKVKDRQTGDVRYLRINRLRGNKYFYFIPYSAYISNSWEHLAYALSINMDTIYKFFEFYDEVVDEIKKEDAIQWCNLNSVGAKKEKE